MRGFTVTVHFDTPARRPTPRPTARPWPWPRSERLYGAAECLTTQANERGGRVAQRLGSVGTSSAVNGGMISSLSSLSRTCRAHQAGHRLLRRRG
jgi:hypothetical protein